MEFSLLKSTQNSTPLAHCLNQQLVLGLTLDTAYHSEPAVNAVHKSNISIYLSAFKLCCVRYMWPDELKSTSYILGNDLFCCRTLFHIWAISISQGNYFTYHMRIKLILSFCMLWRFVVVVVCVFVFLIKNFSFLSLQCVHK